MSSRDDDAFRWEGDDDSAGTDAAPSLPAGYRAVGKGSEAVGSTRDSPSPGDEAGDPAPVRDLDEDAGQTSGDDGEEPAAVAGSPSLGNASLIALGVLGGIYLLFSLGWLIGGLRVHGVASFLVANDGVAPPVWTAGNAAAVGLAVAAPALWFTAVYTLTRDSASWLRWVLLAAGAILFIPWPFIVVGAFGS